MKRTISCLSFVLVSVIAVGVATAGWSGNVLVSKVAAEDTGAGAKNFVVFSTAVPNNCTAAASGYWQLGGGNADHVKNLLSVALSARLSGRAVKVFWNNTCSSGGTSGYPVATGLEIQ